jgi:hypothetical protein
VEWLIIKLSHFYSANTHRRKKQTLFLVSNLAAWIGAVVGVGRGLGWLWTFDAMIGYRFLVVLYLVVFCVVFKFRYTSHCETWEALNPFTLYDDA